MTYPDRRLEGPIEPPDTHSENTQDVVPASERSQDPQRTTRDLVAESSRPLTDDERQAADRDPGIAERVYAPASERVPRTVEGYRDVTENTDTGTPERQAVGQTPASPPTNSGGEPSFTRVPRPGGEPENGGYSSTQTNWSAQPSGHADWTQGTAEHTDWSPQPGRWMSNMSGSGARPVFLTGWVGLAAAGGVGVWLFMRWRRERNKPINRLRRQARQTASEARARAVELREQMPELPDEARRPAVGVGSALLTLAVVLWQQSQARRSAADDARSRTRKMRGKADKASKQIRGRADKAARKAGEAGQTTMQTMAELDWVERLALLRELWEQRAPMAR